jgi:hypothetical protein
MTRIWCGCPLPSSVSNRLILLISTKTCNGLKEHFVLDLESHDTCEVVVHPANEPEHAAVKLLVETLEKPPGLLQLDIDLGDMASPRMTPWAEQGVYIIARPWSQGGTRFTKDDFPLDLAHGTGWLQATRRLETMSVHTPRAVHSMRQGVLIAILPSSAIAAQEPGARAAQHTPGPHEKQPLRAPLQRL